MFGVTTILLNSDVDVELNEKMNGRFRCKTLDGHEILQLCFHSAMMKHSGERNVFIP